MQAQQLMQKDVAVCAPDDSLREVARKLWDNDCGVLPVCEGDSRNLVGVITDRDICMHACFESKPLAELRVSGAMTPEARGCGPEDALSEAERIMREAQVRRLPVINREGGLVGLISLADLAEEAGRERGRPDPQVGEADVGDTLTSICVPHRQTIGAQP